MVVVKTVGARMVAAKTGEEWVVVWAAKTVEVWAVEWAAKMVEEWVVAWVAAAEERVELSANHRIKEDFEMPHTLIPGHS